MVDVSLTCLIRHKSLSRRLDAEFVLLHTEAVISIPKDLDPAEAAPLVCAGVTTFNSIRNMDLHPGDLVAIQGIGGV